MSEKSRLGENFRPELDKPKHSETLLILKMSANYTTKNQQNDFSTFRNFNGTYIGMVWKAVFFSMHYIKKKKRNMGFQIYYSFFDNQIIIIQI